MLLFNSDLRLDGVIQLIHTYTNKPIQNQIPRIYVDCPVQIIRKNMGIYTFLNAEKESFSVKVELPHFLLKHFIMKKEKIIKPKPVRCTPDPRYVIGKPPAGTTYFTGIYNANEPVYLVCPVKYCKIKFCQTLEDGRILFESRNFLHAETGRWLRLESDTRKTMLIQTDIDSKYNPLRYFVTEKAVVDFGNIKSISPVFYSHTDDKGRFIIAVEYAESGECSLIDSDGNVIKSINYNPVSWVEL